MKLRYFVVSHRGRLRRVSRHAVQSLWEGRRHAAALGSRLDTELRLVSVACNAELLPQKVYLLRLPLTNGRFTLCDYLTLQSFARPDCVTPQEVKAHHTDGWPPDMARQLAVALDVPVSNLRVPVGIGGPLLIAAALRLTPVQALRYLV